MSLHIILSRKGGVGKSLIASILMEHFSRSGFLSSPVGIDLDPKNSSFSDFSGFNVRTCEFLGTGPAAFDALDKELVDILNHSPADNFVFDTSGYGFDGLIRHLFSSGALDVLVEEGHKVVLHLPLVGGPSYSASKRSLTEVMKSCGEAMNIVVWINDYFGRPDIDLQNSVDFMELSVDDRASLKQRMTEKYSDRSTTGEIRGSRSVFVSREIQTFYNDLYDQLDKIECCGEVTAEIE